jgi:hypothetical protein
VDKREQPVSVQLVPILEKRVQLLVEQQEQQGALDKRLQQVHSLKEVMDTLQHLQQEALGILAQPQWVNAEEKEA